jgi:hypothetical protein
MNAVRNGAPVAVVASGRAIEPATIDDAGNRDSMAGTATKAPSPRKKLRRDDPNLFMVIFPNQKSIQHLNQLNSNLANLEAAFQIANQLFALFFDFHFSSSLKRI